MGTPTMPTLAAASVLFETSQPRCQPGQSDNGDDVPFRSLPKHVVENLEHVVVVPDLRLARRVVLIRRLGRDLIPHLGEVHVDARVALDHLLELAQHGDELLLSMLVNMINCFTQPLPVNAVVGRQPISGSGKVVSVLSSVRMCCSVDAYLLTRCLDGMSA